MEIRFLQVLWSTNALNKSLLKWAGASKLRNIWFNIGTCVSLCLLPVSIYLLFVAFAQNFTNASDTEYILQPVVPGVTLPASEIGFYSICLLLGSALHELGHALAAIQEEVPIINVGIHIIFILPVAYVNINSDKLFSLNAWKRLKILCAGVWHNLVIALIAYLCYLSLSIVFSPLFEYGNGVIVAKIALRSPIAGSRGLNAYDRILEINDCQITDEESWFRCLSALKTHKPAFCIEADVVHNLDESVQLKHLENGIISCCHSDNKGKLCFEYLDTKDSILELPPYACLPGRAVIEMSKNFCMADPHSCPKETFCFRPVLVNNTNLYRIKREGANEVIYIGPLSDLIRTITVSSYVPKHKFLSTAIPDFLTKFMGYLTAFSMGLAIVNILPCLFMDGQHIINTLLHLLLARHLRTTHITGVAAVITASFSVFLVVHCIFVIWNFINY